MTEAATPTRLPPDRRSRFLAAPYLTGSDETGKRGAAGLKLTVSLRSTGLVWEDLLTGCEPGQAELAPAPVASGWRADAMVCRQRLGFLRIWEAAFLASLAGIAVPTRKQVVVLAALVP